MERKSYSNKVLTEAKVALWETELNNMSGEIEYSLAKQAYVLAFNE